MPAQLLQRLQLVDPAFDEDTGVVVHTGCVVEHPGRRLVVGLTVSLLRAWMAALDGKCCPDIRQSQVSARVLGVDVSSRGRINGAPQLAA